MDKLAAFIFLIIFMLAFGAFGGYFITYYNSTDVTISATPTVTPGTPGDPAEIEEPSSISALSWAFNGLGFIFGLSAFTVAGVPILFSFLTWIVDAVWVFLLILVIRGN